MKKPVITDARPADDNHRVITVEGGKGTYRRQPCPICPWRVDATGQFPAEAFRLSANTAYDMSNHTFGCHEAGAKKTATCAGFLLHGAAHNLAIRLRAIEGELFKDVHDGGHDLFLSYRDMAEANGVDPSDPSLDRCRSD